MKRKKNMTVKDEQRQFKSAVINFVDYEDVDYLFIDTSSGEVLAVAGGLDDFYEDMSKGKLPDSSYAIIKVVEIDMYRVNGETKESSSPKYSKYLDQNEIMKDVLWNFVSDKDIPEINKMFEEELAKLRGEDG